MTIADILASGYGIDLDSLTFKMQAQLTDAPSPEAVKKSLANDEFIVDGETDLHFDLYFDEPKGFIEIYHYDD